MMHIEEVGLLAPGPLNVQMLIWFLVKTMCNMEPKSQSNSYSNVELHSALALVFIFLLSVLAHTYATICAGYLQMQKCKSENQYTEILHITAVVTGMTFTYRETKQQKLLL